MTNRTKCSRNPLEDEAIQKTAERALKESRRREEEQIMEGNTMNEQILMKLAEAEKKRSFKQKLKDNAWTIGLSTSAPSVGFAIDQQRRNIKKEKATGEKPKSLIERRPGTVGGAVAGALASPLSRMALNSMIGVRTSPAQLASEMVTGAAGGALGGALIVDPLTRWGTKRYYRKKDEKALKNQQRNELLAKRFAEDETLRQAQVRQAEKYLQENPLQKTAAYGDVVRGNERILMKLAEAEKKSGLTEMQRAMLGGAIGAASGWSLGGVLFNSPATRKQVAAAAGAGALLGLGDTALRKRLRRQPTNANLQKTAAYGDFVRNLGRNYERKVGRGYLDAFKKFQKATGKVDKASFQEANKSLAKRLTQSRTVGRVAHKYAPAITTGAIGLGAAGAAAGTMAAVRAIKNKRQGQEKTASYHAARELLGLPKEASVTLAGPQSIKKIPAKDQILKMIRDLAKKK